MSTEYLFISKPFLPPMQKPAYAQCQRGICISRGWRIRLRRVCREIQRNLFCFIQKKKKNHQKHIRQVVSVYRVIRWVCPMNERRIVIYFDVIANFCIDTISNLLPFPLHHRKRKKMLRKWNFPKILRSFVCFLMMGQIDILYCLFRNCRWHENF